MRISDRGGRLARLAACATLAAGLAGAAAPAASARTSFPGVNPKGAASWGANGIGQLGTGTAGGYRALFGPVSGLALRSDGTVWAWGSGAGPLVNGNPTSPATPVQVAGLTGVVEVSAGSGQFLALRSDGTVWAWGANREGQVGDGAISPWQASPVQVTGLTGVTRISAGGLFSLALRSDGTVWAWGYNQDGELGNGTLLNSAVPVQVTGLSHITSIAAGNDGSSLAVQTTVLTGATWLWAWGANRAGELGDGTTSKHTTPEQVTGIGAPGIAGVTAGDEFSLVLGTDGSVWGWGADGFSQLGNIPDRQPVTRPVRTVGPGSGITQLAAGINHVLALRSNGTVLGLGQ